MTVTAPRTLAAVLVKSLDESKQRLSSELRPPERRTLAEAMLRDVLAAVRRVPSVDRVAVVTPRGAARELALGEGAAVVSEESAAGQSLAGELAIAAARRAGYERIVLLPADLPLLDPGELEGALRRAAAACAAVAILADRRGEGTNGLVLTPPAALVPSFGPGSLERHRRLARGRRCRVETLPSVALDVDTPDDLAELACALAEAPPDVARWTRAALARLPGPAGPGSPAEVLRV